VTLYLTKGTTHDLPSPTLARLETRAEKFGTEHIFETAETYLRVRAPGSLRGGCTIRFMPHGHVRSVNALTDQVPGGSGLFTIIDRE
jgi:hypothetical protein